MTEKESAYTPVTEGASPDAPVPTMQYVNPDDVHPSREDYDRERKRRMMVENTMMVAPKPFKVKVAEALDWITVQNDRIHFSAGMWCIIFMVYWMAAVIVNMGMIIGLNAVYTVGKYTFDTGLTAGLLNVAGFLTIIVFPAYAVFYLVLAIAEASKRRREYKHNMELQERFL